MSKADSFPSLSYALALSDPDAFISELRSALSTAGFFNLVDLEGIEGFVPAWDEIFQATDEFFRLSDEEKLAIRIMESRHFRGYSAVGVEVTAGQRDLREQIDLGPETLPYTAYPPTSLSPDSIPLCLYGPNLYPVSLPQFKPALRAYRSHCANISTTLMSLIAQSLTPQPELITELFNSETYDRTPDYSRMKVVRYPRLENVDGLGVGPHKDGGALTLLAQDDVGGLEVQVFNGEWVGVLPRKYSLVINVGQVIERISNGLYPATTHRVLPVPPTSPHAYRLSIPFFFSPVLTAAVNPLPLSSLHPHLVPQLSEMAAKEIKSEVVKADLHEDLFGRAAWRGITRSNIETWEKWYGPEMDGLGGPERNLLSKGENRELVII